MANIFSVPTAKISAHERKSTVCYMSFLLPDWVFLSSLETLCIYTKEAQERAFTLEEWESANGEADLQP